MATLHTPGDVHYAHTYKPVDVDTVSTDNDYESITILRDNDKDIRFDGVLLAEVSSKDFNPGIKRYTVLALYRTRAGAHICEQVGCSDIDGEVERCSAHIADTIDDVLAYFGNGWLAKELYAVAGISAITHVA